MGISHCTYPPNFVKIAPEIENNGLELFFVFFCFLFFVFFVCVCVVFFFKWQLWKVDILDQHLQLHIPTKFGQDCSKNEK